MTDFTVGDKVEVSYDATVTSVDEEAVVIKIDDTDITLGIYRERMKENGGHLVVNVTEKAVEIFGPGSVVRHRTGYVYTILEDGKYFDHNANGIFDDFTFDSRNYEASGMISLEIWHNGALWDTTTYDASKDYEEPNGLEDVEAMFNDALDALASTGEVGEQFTLIARKTG